MRSWIGGVLDYWSKPQEIVPEKRFLRDPFADRTRSVYDIEDALAATGVLSDNGGFGISDVYTACSIYGNALASMDFMAYIDGVDEDIDQPDHWLTKLFNDSVNDYMSPSDFKITAMFHWGITGNFNALITRNRRGEVISLDILDPSNLTKVFVRDGKKYWEYSDINKPIPDEKVFHIAGPSLDGLMGANPIEAHRTIFNASNYMHNYREKFFQNGAALKHVIEMDETLDPVEYQNFMSSWHRVFSGPNNAGKTAILENGMKLKPIQINPIDAAYLDLSSDARKTIANIYRLPIFLFNEYAEGSQYENIESQNLFFVNYSMAPMAKKWEEEICRKLVGKKSKLRGRFDLFSLARGDMKSVADYAKNFFVLGALNQDEIRKKYLKMNPLPNNQGSRFFVQGNNMVPIDKIDQIYEQKLQGNKMPGEGGPDTNLDTDLPSIKEKS